jgi:predicted nucleotidyltransferase
MRYQKEIKKIVDQIVRNYKPEKIILFGGFTYDKIKENSDIDLVAIKKT